MRISTLTAKLYATAGVLFAVASLIVARDAARTLDFWIGDRHYAVHLYWIAAAICWLWSVVYYALHRLLLLRPQPALSLVHFAITLAVLIGLSTIRYAGFAAKPHSASGAWLAIIVASHAAAFTALSFGVFILIVTWSLLDRAQAKRPRGY